MDPVSATLMAASLAGGILGIGSNKPKSIDPEWLKKHFGAGAVNDEMIQLFNHVINSPQGQQMMTSAAEQGQQFNDATARGAAAAGMGPSGGADSGSSIFSQAAAGGATNSLQRGVRSNVMEMVMPVAQNIVNSRMNAAVQSQLQTAGDPSKMQQLGGLLSRGANAALAAGVGSPGAAPGAGKTIEVGSNLPVKALTEAANMPQTIQGRGTLTGTTSTIPSISSGTTFKKRPGFLSRLVSRFSGGGMQRLATSAYGDQQWPK